MPKIKPCKDQATGVLNGNYYFLCPACKKTHEFSTKVPWNPGQIIYNYDGNEETPTLSPTIKIIDGLYTTTNDASLPYSNMPQYVCHSAVVLGYIRFLEDSTHALRGRSVPLPELK